MSIAKLMTCTHTHTPTRISAIHYQLTYTQTIPLKPAAAAADQLSFTLLYFLELLLLLSNFSLSSNHLPLFLTPPLPHDQQFAIFSPKFSALTRFTLQGHSLIFHALSIAHTNTTRKCAPAERGANSIFLLLFRYHLFSSRYSCSSRQ